MSDTPVIGRIEFNPLHGVHLPRADPFDLLPPPPAPPIQQVAADGRRTFTLTVEGEPVPKLQGSIITISGHGSIKKNPKTRRYEEIVRERATHVWNGQPLIDNVPICMTVKFYRAIPKSFTKRQLQGIAMGIVRPITKPDNTNLVKAFEDGLNGVVFRDDALIVDSHIEKWYSDRPRVELTLTW